MKTRGLLNADLGRLIASPGHTDLFCNADCGLPIPPGVTALVEAIAVPVTRVPHTEFKRETAQARFVVRTGAARPYANVLLTAGVAS